MNDYKLTSLLFEGRFTIRVVIRKTGEPWFLANDIYDALDINRQNDVLSRLDSDERSQVSLKTEDGKKVFSVVNESGASTLSFLGNKEEGLHFRKWVSSEVMPYFKFHDRTFLYGESPDEEVTETFSQKLAAVRETRQVFGVKCAAQLWFDLNLPRVPAMYHDDRQLEIFENDNLVSLQKDDAA